MLGDALGRYERRRKWLLDELRQHQPFLLLASFSFVIAAFLRGSEAAGLAAAAAIAFLNALFFSIRLDSLEAPDLAMTITFYASVGYGFILLAVDAVVIIWALPGVVQGIVAASVILLAILGLLAALEPVLRLRNRAR